MCHHRVFRGILAAPFRLNGPSFTARLAAFRRHRRVLPKCTSNAPTRKGLHRPTSIAGPNLGDAVCSGVARDMLSPAWWERRNQGYNNVSQDFWHRLSAEPPPTPIGERPRRGRIRGSRLDPSTTYQSPDSIGLPAARRRLFRSARHGGDPDGQARFFRGGDFQDFHRGCLFSAAIPILRCDPRSALHIDQPDI